MNRDDIIRMAQEAGIRVAENNSFADDMYISVLYRFANIVAASEREACAKVTEKTVCDTHLPTGVKIYGTKAAAAIRARGDKC